MPTCEFGNKVVSEISVDFQPLGIAVLDARHNASGTWTSTSPGLSLSHIAKVADIGVVSAEESTSDVVADKAPSAIETAAAGLTAGSAAGFAAGFAARFTLLPVRLPEKFTNPISEAESGLAAWLAAWLAA